MERRAGRSVKRSTVATITATRKGSMSRTVRAFLLATVLAVLAACGGSSDDAAGPAAKEDVTVASGPDSPDCPVRNHLASEYNGRTRGGVETPIDYAFLEAQRGGCHPVRFNPCEPIHYVVNSTLAPAGVVEDLREAIGKVEAATGLTFVDDGPTDETASNNRTLSQPRYGNRWAPVLISWERGERFRMAATNPAGGQSTAVDDVYVSGVLIVNADAIQPARGFGEGNTWGRVFIHELGHIVGLGHVARSDQIMFPELGVQRGRAEFHAGDLAGLRLIGREAGCLTTPPAPVRR